MANATDKAANGRTLCRFPIRSRSKFSFLSQIPFQVTVTMERKINFHDTFRPLIRFGAVPKCTTLMWIQWLTCKSYDMISIEFFVLMLWANECVCADSVSSAALSYALNVRASSGSNESYRVNVSVCLLARLCPYRTVFCTHFRPRILLLAMHTWVQKDQN